jgi:hypothetical protein
MQNSSKVNNESPAQFIFPEEGISAGTGGSESLGFVAASVGFGCLGLMPGVGFFFAVMGVVTGLIGSSLAAPAGHHALRITSWIGTGLSILTLMISCVEVFLCGRTMVEIVGGH